MTWKFTSMVAARATLEDQRERDQHHGHSGSNQAATDCPGPSRRGPLVGVSSGEYTAQLALAACTYHRPGWIGRRGPPNLTRDQAVERARA